MYTHLLQDWTTLRGTAALTALNQPENGVLDLSMVQDVVGWLEVKEVTPTTGVLQIAYQTAPTKDDGLFVPMIPAISVTGPGVTTTAMLKNVSLVPLTRWLRWQLSLTSGTTWDITFRIYLSCNVVGRNHARPAVGSAMTV
jgi:hypothetical protein